MTKAKLIALDKSLFILLQNGKFLSIHSHTRARMILSLSHHIPVYQTNTVVEGHYKHHKQTLQPQ